MPQRQRKLSTSLKERLPARKLLRRRQRARAGRRREGLALRGGGGARAVAQPAQRRVALSG